MAIITGDNKDNLFDGTLEAESFNGLGGFDTVSYATSGETVVVFLDGVGALGTAQGDTYTSIENLIGSTFGDVLVGDANGNNIFGGGGFDEIAGGAGNDRLRGEGKLFGGADDDNLLSGDGNNSLFGGAGDDFLIGSAGVDLMDGGIGFDTLSFEGSEAGVSLSLINGGQLGNAAGDRFASIERVLGTRFGDTISGDDLGNEIDGREGNDLLKGFGGADRLDGSFGNDTLLGGDGDDVMFGGVGADSLNGGTGNDSIEYVDAFNAVTVDLAQGKGFGSDAQGDTYQSIEIVFGSEFGDTLIGDVFANTLFGEFGNDTLFGGTGNDALAGGDGSDRMFGGFGDDIYSVVNSGDVVDESFAFGIDTVRSGITFSLANTTQVKGSVENLTLTGTLDTQAFGNALDNVLIGNSGDNRLSGSLGADTMRGMAGDDEYFVESAGDLVDESAPGSGGVDVVNASISFSLSGTKALGTIENLDLTGSANINAAGNALANGLEGNAGRNDLMGLGGNDVLTGFGGADTFVFNAALNAVTNVDTITDFRVADDTMRLENAFMTVLSTGQLGAAAFHIGAVAADASDRIIYNSGTGALSYDADGSGSGAAVKFAQLDTGLALTSADFFVV
jgi:Ca2+-binding RTX toxin-like protein